MYTRNSPTLGAQSNVNEDDTSQWKLWIGIYLKCIHEQGGYFLHNSKNKRNRWINLLLYQWSKNYLPFRGSWVHTHFLCGVSVSLFLLLCKKYPPCSWIHLRYIPIHNFHWLVSSSLTFDCAPSVGEFRVYILWPSCENGFM
jgi:hypothetical protein